MKRNLLTILIFFSTINLFAQNRVSVAAGGGYDCLYAYNVQYNTFNDQFMSDMYDCSIGIVMNWVGMDPISAGMSSDCAYSALNRFYTNCDNASDAFAACSGVVIRN